MPRRRADQNWTHEQLFSGAPGSHIPALMGLLGGRNGLRTRRALAVAVVFVGMLTLAVVADGAPARDAAAHGQVIQQRPSYYIPFEELPADADTAIAILQNRLFTVAPLSGEERDIQYLLRLGRLYLGPEQPEGRRETVSHTLRVNAWWYTRYVVPRRRVILLDFEGILSTYWAGRGFAVNPVATAGRWQELNRSYAPEQLAEALLAMGVERHGKGRDFMLWEYYDVPDQPGRIRPGASGMAQGRISQLMARAYHRTGETRFADAARLALAAFTVPVNSGGVLSPVAEPLGGRPMPWYVERAYPGANPWKGAALNGFMVTLLNLHATAPLLGSRPNPLDAGPPDQRARERAPGAAVAGSMARALARRGERTLKRYLPLHDTGTWSLYGLLTPGRKWRTYVADAGYHCYHVTLLHELAKIAPGLGFAGVSDRWNRYALNAGVHCKPTAGPQRISPSSQ